MATCDKIETVSHLRNKAFRSRGSVALREGGELSVTKRNDVKDRASMLGTAVKRSTIAVVRTGGCVRGSFKERCLKPPRNPAGHSVNPDSVNDPSCGVLPANIMVKGVQGPRLLMRNLRNIGAGNLHPSRNEAKSVSRVRSPMRLEFSVTIFITSSIVSWLVVDQKTEAVIETVDCLDRSRTYRRSFPHPGWVVSIGTLVHRVPSPKTTCLQYLQTPEILMRAFIPALTLATSLRWVVEDASRLTRTKEALRISGGRLSMVDDILRGSLISCCSLNDVIVTLVLTALGKAEENLLEKNRRGHDIKTSDCTPLCVAHGNCICEEVDEFDPYMHIDATNRDGKPARTTSDSFAWETRREVTRKFSVKYRPLTDNG